MSVSINGEGEAAYRCTKGGDGGGGGGPVKPA